MNLLMRLGIADAGSVQAVRPLTGGVASDIAVVETAAGRLAVKFALETLRVAEEWRASPERNAAEYRWLQYAGSQLPGSAPTLYGRDPVANGFAMEYLDGADTYQWKEALLAGQPLRGEAEAVGDALGRLHAGSTGFAQADRSAFDNFTDFRDLRLEPYLAFTAGAHPELAPNFEALIASQSAHRFAVIHGDVSPKNILFRDGQPVFLDAECATWGDPSFDVAFCTNHLLLKSIYMPERAAAILGAAEGMWRRYREHVCWEDPTQLEARIAALLPALALARVDGKSPVEYLDETSRERVRSFAIPLIRQPAARIADIAESVLRLSSASQGQRS